MLFIIIGCAGIAFVVGTILGIGLLGAFFFGSIIYAVMLFGHGLIRGIEALANKLGWFAALVFYSLFYVPLLLLNWIGSIMMVDWMNNSHQNFFGSFIQPFGASRGAVAWVNREGNVIVGHFAHFTYHLWGATTSPLSPHALIEMLFAGQIDTLALVGVIWLVSLVVYSVLTGQVVRWQKRARKARNLEELS